MGEVKVGFTAGKEDQILSLKEVSLVSGSKTKTLSVEKVRLHKQYALIKFKGIDTVNEVLELKGSFLKIPKGDLVKTFEEDEFLIDDLAGCKVYDQNKALVGEITEIANIRGQDMLIMLDEEKKEYFLPFVKEIVPVVDIENKKIIINNIPGLLDPEECEVE